MPELRSTYDGRLIYETSYTKGARLFLGTIHLQSCKIVWDSVRKLAYEFTIFLKEILALFKSLS